MSHLEKRIVSLPALAITLLTGPAYLMGPAFAARPEDPSSYRIAFGVLAALVMGFHSLWLLAIYRLGTAAHKPSPWAGAILWSLLAVAGVLALGGYPSPIALPAKMVWVGLMFAVFWKTSETLYSGDGNRNPTVGQIFLGAFLLAIPYIGAWLLRPRLIRLGPPKSLGLLTQ